MEEQGTPKPTLPGKQEIIQNIAQSLVERRKARNLSLDKIHQAIKIRLPYLQSIEKGEWDQLPGEVYVRGFIRRYAVYLGLDGDKLLAPYIQFFVSEETRPEESFSILNAGDNVRMRFLLIGIGFLFLVILVRLIKQERSVGLVNHAAQNVSLARPPEVENPPATAVVPTPEHLLEVYSPYQLWLRVTSDDKTFEGFIPPSSTWTWKANGTFSIRLGHSRKVALSFDGLPVTLNDSQKILQLPHEN